MPPFRQKTQPLKVEPPDRTDSRPTINPEELPKTLRWIATIMKYQDFLFYPEHLANMVLTESLSSLHKVGGLAGLEMGLRTDVQRGLADDQASIFGSVNSQHALSSGKPCCDIRAGAGDKLGPSLADRRRKYGDNALPVKTSPFDELRAPALFLVFGLEILGFVSCMLARRLDWFALVVSALVLTIPFQNALHRRRASYSARRRAAALPEREVKVMRSGRTCYILMSDIVVGDVVALEPGDIVPADGIFIRGHGLICEDFITSQPTKKRPADDAMEALLSDRHLDPFIISGSKVLEGIGYFLVTGTGANSAFGKSLINDTAKQDHCWYTQLLYPVGWWRDFMASLINIICSPTVLAIDCYLIQPIVEAIAAASHVLMPPLMLLSSFLTSMLSSNLLDHDQTWTRGVTLPLVMNGNTLHAIPDTGADENVISTKCVLGLGLNIKADPYPVTFKLANGRCVKSCGVVRASLTFARGRVKPELKEVSFKVFPALAVPIILGRHFLKETETLSKYDDRLQKSPAHSLSSVPRVFHLSAPKQRLRCYLDGLPVYANADTGAEMNLASRKWAVKNKVDIKKPAPGHDRVMLADGSIVRITGQFSAKFRASHRDRGGTNNLGKAYTKHFFILDGLTSDVLLCQDLLLEMRAFKEHHKAFIELDSSDSFADLNLVSWLSKRERRFLKSFRKEKEKDSPSSSPPKPPLPTVSDQDQLHLNAAREQDRHSQAVREISRLPESERHERLRAETERHVAILERLTASIVARSRPSGPVSVSSMPTVARI